jgi:hypothetical protein
LQPIDEQGYVIVAVNTPTVDYVECAQRLATTIKHWDPGAKTCLITDQQHTDPVFDHVRLLTPETNPYANDAQLFGLSPFRETIKLEADMLIVSPIDHWWTQFRHRDVVISTGCKNWQNQPSRSRHYRQVFDFNHLPDVYNAITYWRLSNTAQEFFGWVRDIFANWDEFKRLIKFPDQIPSTDLVYAMAAEIMGRDRVTMPWGLYPKITHMKKQHAGTTTEQWPLELVWEYSDWRLRIQTVEQVGAFHYHIKDWQP